MHPNDPRTTIGADPRRFTVDAEDRSRLEVIAARTGGIVETEPTHDGLKVRHIAATGRTTEVTGQSAPEAINALSDALGAE